MSKRTLFFISMVLLAGALLVSCGPTSASATSPSSSTSNGQTLLQQRCSVCHSLSRIETAHKTTDQWKTMVDRMISHGAQLTPQEEQVLVDYLAQNYK